MYKDEVKRLLSEKKSYHIYLIKECVIIYAALLFNKLDTTKSRRDLVTFLKDYFKYSDNENEILLNIKNSFGNVECDNDIDDILEILDKRFFNVFNYNEYILKGYDDALETGELDRAYIVEPEFVTSLDEEKNKIKTLIKENRTK